MSERKAACKRRDKRVVSLDLERFFNYQTCKTITFLALFLNVHIFQNYNFSAYLASVYPSPLKIKIQDAKKQNLQKC